MADIAETWLEIVDRIYRGRHQLLSLGATLAADRVEIVMSVDAHMRIMTADRDYRWRSTIQLDPQAPAGIRIFGLAVRRDPTLEPYEIRFRSEVSV
jgi:hypothetical protein